MTALDTNVLIDLESGNANVAAAALRAVDYAANGGPIILCAAVYAEYLANPYVTDKDVASGGIDVALAAAHIHVDGSFSRAVLVHAASAFRAYARRRASSSGSAPRRILADFLIGAHACTVGKLVTSDAAFYRRTFSELAVIDVRDF